MTQQIKVVLDSGNGCSQSSKIPYAENKIVIVERTRRPSINE